MKARDIAGHPGYDDATTADHETDCAFSEVLRANPRIETERCILRRFTPDDAQALLAWGSDKDVLEHLVWQGVTNLEEASASIVDYHSKNPGSYAIEVKATGECIGDISLRLTPEHEKASFGFVLAKNHWGKGYMTEILTVVLDFCFNTLDLNRVEACHFLGNEGSGKVMEKCGMHLEGVSKQQLFVKGKFVDTYHYAITKDDYLN